MFDKEKELENLMQLFSGVDFTNPYKGLKAMASAGDFLESIYIKGKKEGEKIKLTQNN